MADEARPINPDDAIAVLTQILGTERVSADPALRRLMSQDIYYEGATPACVAAPTSTAEVSAVVAAATARGFAVAPRGGGMSYTAGYTTQAEAAVLLDLRGMDRILEVNAADMTVTVEAGATWAALHAALTPHGLRTPFWGPLSGISSTIGGGLSQNNAFFGAGLYGPTADSVVSVTVVTADGAVVRTGTAGAAGAKPFFRHYGPDLTGLFLGDAGALGVKTEATFRLIPRPEHEAWLSFSFATAAASAQAMSALARAGLGAELFGFDPNLAKIRLKRASLLADAKALLGVVGAQKSLIAGLKEGAKIALAGRGFLEEDAYSLHVTLEGRSRAAVDADVAAVRKIATEAGGQEVENTIPKVIRATPFTPLNNILGPGGERWAPIHGIVAHSAAPACWAAIEAAFEARRPAFEANGITTGFLITTLSTNGFLIEPVFFWPGERFAVHEATVEADYLAKLPPAQAHPAAAALVEAARAEVLAVFTRFGAAHFQVGRAYPLLATREPTMAALLVGLKRTLDPKGLMNPGALGL